MEETYGAGLRRRREAAGLSRAQLAATLGVDASSVASWERGDYRPRGARLAALQVALDGSGKPQEPPFDVRLVDTFTDLPAALDELLPETRVLRALRLAAPYPTPARVQVGFREELARRLGDGSLKVLRVEIFYNLERVREAIWNVRAYDPNRYALKAFLPGVREVAPAIGGYFFDERVFIMGAYWTGTPPDDKPGIRLSGAPFRAFFMSYWREIWGRGTLLNGRGGHDLSALREIALGLGVKPRDWPAFADGAKALDIGDGAPPLI